MLEIAKRLFCRILEYILKAYLINTVNWWCILRHVVPYCPYGRVNVSHSDLHTIISFLNLWEILHVKSQNSKQCGCKSVCNGGTGPCNNWFLKNHFPQQPHTFGFSVVAFLRFFTDMYKPVSIQDPDYLCFHINVTMTSDWVWGTMYVRNTYITCWRGLILS